MSDDKRLQVGFRDVASFAAGVSVTIMLDSTALIIAATVFAGAGAGPGLSTGLMVGMVAAVGFEMLRRYVLLTRNSGGRRAVGVLRALIWMVLAATPTAFVFTAIGVARPCFGQACDFMSKIVMEYMLGCCVVSLLLAPLGYRLLRRAAWLQPRDHIFSGTETHS